MSQHDQPTMQELLVRIDERTQRLENDIKTMKENSVTKEEFWPVKSLVYGGVGVVLVAIVGAFLHLILKLV